MYKPWGYDAYCATPVRGCPITYCECSSGEIYLQSLPDARFTGDVERAATALLTDFRKGLLGPLCIEFPESDGEAVGADAMPGR